MSTISPPIKAKAERRRTTKLTQTMAKNKSRLPKSATSQLNEVTHPDMVSSSHSGAIGTGLFVSPGKPAATGGLAFLVGSYTMMSTLIYLVLPVLYTYLLCQPCVCTLGLIEILVGDLSYSIYRYGNLCSYFDTSY
jgi:hypothetical protein